MRKNEKIRVCPLVDTLLKTPDMLNIVMEKLKV